MLLDMERLWRASVDASLQIGAQPFPIRNDRNRARKPGFGNLGTSCNAIRKTDTIHAPCPITASVIKKVQKQSGTNTRERPPMREIMPPPVEGVTAPERGGKTPESAYRE
jgi:hypothetical protein